MVAASSNNGSNNSAHSIDLDFLQGLAPEISDEQKGLGSDYLVRPNYCQQCHQSFTSSKMLQAHNATAHADKTFVCEICGKAFRFRSNLAEHRSVHTAVKPFVCKFCGKSSRLKGNLTKHILKHHKMEQIDCIGKDDIIIKKGKKSVKDPAAIDFLEKSMIVLQNAAHAARIAVAHNWEERVSAGGTPPSFEDERHNNDADVELARNSVGGNSGGFLMSLGLDAGSIDLKNAPDDSPEDSCAGTSRASSMNFGDLIHAQNSQNAAPHTPNDQLLERCKMEIDEEEDEDENSNNADDEVEVSNHQDSHQTNDALLAASANNAGSKINCEDYDFSAGVSNFAAAFAGANTNGAKMNNGGGRQTPGGTTSGASNNSVALAAACKALLFGNMAAAAAASAKRTTSSTAPNSSNSNASYDENVNSLEGEELLSTHDTRASNSAVRKSSILGSNNSNSPTSGLPNGGGGPTRTTTVSSQCPECGKHLRKPRDLIAHLSAIHKISPCTPLPSTTDCRSSHNANNVYGGVKEGIINNGGPSSNASAGSPMGCGGGSTASAMQELLQLRQLVGDLKSAAPSASSVIGGVGGSTKLEQMMINLDTRVGRLERQLEMALNSIYTLVQLQTGINNQVTRFRDETADQLRNVVNILNGGAPQ